MRLDELIETENDISDIVVEGMTADSREAEKGFVFFALKGHAPDGHIHAADAVARGAVAVVAEAGSAMPALSVPVVPVADIRHALGVAAARFYTPQPDIVTAVTGTSGKTSVVSFLRQIWENTGFASASIGTIGVVSARRTHYGALTTPGPVELHRLLQALNHDGVTHVAMEASSHGIDQHRLDGVRLAAAAFTNLGRDHMDYHATVEAYFAAKMRLFDTLLPKDAPAIVYSDDKYSDKAVAHITQAKRKVLGVGRRGEFIRIKRVEHERFRQYAEFECEGGIYEVQLPLAGDFQVANAVVAAGLAIVTGVAPAAVFRALERLEGAPGRLDLVGATADGAPVYVDYAHKPEALENVLKSVRPFTTGRVIVVFGCGGDRDQGKRPIMGGVACELADVVIVTDDNPRSENPSTIRKQILTGAAGALEIADRREAIRHAVAMMTTGDTLIVAGKGHEEGQIVGSDILPFSDHAEVRAALEGRKT
ncbi:MAG: UDP-N-acetylmuramoyl-L-alanyl-D-glutamate--2,6-diaminopimelate ligase [Candidatus Tokpelaia hoelldobleri]|uniref:UDP-N-acetylmuramoyl-L-alanyl-D-glutamate--2,6-diaminopimelate ligase n=1 Tax=Candidatus Tokpelaia hoelldobleri TaxID=1902579 RepID=A0A1U9JVZ3_9HYPH|nr:MAG: UDP-N-acetylmuramoyl-L-alanyl-D-glutamate--2,6-diaminopimelate ligase [Candidatus Tokpelaia hoelldoblerii]